MGKLVTAQQIIPDPGPVGLMGGTSIGPFTCKTPPAAGPGPVVGEFNTPAGGTVGPAPVFGGLNVGPEGAAAPAPVFGGFIGSAAYTRSVKKSADRIAGRTKMRERFMSGVIVDVSLLQRHLRCSKVDFSEFPESQRNTGAHGAGRRCDVRHTSLAEINHAASRGSSCRSVRSNPRIGDAETQSVWPQISGGEW